jgi:hypothetical protein
MTLPASLNSANERKRVSLIVANAVAGVNAVR